MKESTKKKKIVQSVIALILVLGLCVGCANPALSEGTNSGTANGTYSGTANGMGLVTVTIDVENGKIKSAQVDTSHETKGIGYELGDKLAQQIVDAQSSKIEGVSGATVTCSAASTAAQTALEAAGLVEKSTGIMVPGVYTGSSRGSLSTIRMAVEVDENRILNVWNLENGDSIYLRDKAMEAIPQRILDNQSLAVDALTGATLTSRGIISAVGDAMQKAGANVSEWSVVQNKEKVQGPTEEYDVVVVGGGASGLTAALAAKTDSKFSKTDSGLKVLVVESNGFAGGNLAVCGGYMASFFGTPLNDVTGISWNPDDLVDALENSRPEYKDLVNDYIMRKVVGKNADVINGLMNRGFWMSTEDAVVATSGNMSNDGSVSNYTGSVAANPVTGMRSGENGYDLLGGSTYLARTLARLTEDAGVEIRLNTKADSLNVENGVCTGINVVTSDSTYRINAKKVILATGYAGFDAETISQFFPEYYKNVVPSQNASSDSFAQKAIKGMGGDVVVLPEMDYIAPGYNSVLGIFGEEGVLHRNMNTVWVDVNGNRFFDETAPSTGRGVPVAGELLKLDGGHAYMIFDSTHKGAAFYDNLAAHGLAWKADNLDELANLAGITAENLTATINKYNTDYENGGDATFGAKKESMAPVVKGPFYAVRVNAVSPAGSDASIYVDNDMTVMLHKDGGRIENLYAAGGVASNSFILAATGGLGTHVSTAMFSGSYAGDCARDAILGK